MIARVGSWLSSAGTAAACAAGDQALTLGIQLADRRQFDRLRLDVVVLSKPVACPALSGARLRLTWYLRDSELIEILPIPGEVWHVQARLKLPWGMRNPGGFDYGLWLKGNDYVATGWVRTGARMGAAEPSYLRALQKDAFREYVNAGLLRALVLGDRAGVADEQWALFRDTGTIHLMVVSGLQVGVVAGLLFACVFGLLRCVPGVSTYIAPHALSGVASIFGVVALVIITSAHAPVVRAGMMASLIVILVLLRRRIPWWLGLGLVMFIALVVQPRIVVQQGFWLSYAAVASLVWTFAPRWRRMTWVRGLLVCQLALTLGLPPWLNLTVGSIPAISPFANIIVVPLMTLCTIPLAIVGLLLQWALPWLVLSNWLIIGADLSLSVALEFLSRINSALPSFGNVSTGSAAIAYLAFLITCLPGVRVIRLLAVLGWMPLLLPNKLNVEPGEFRLQVLDVGQGSSAIVDTARRRLIVDAGAAFGDSFSMGSAVVMPALAATGPARPDALLVSHWDNDHAGGVDQLMQAWPALQMLDCKHGHTWVWDAVRFIMLMDEHAKSANERSCTLLAQGASGSAYLSGDIEHRSERSLLPGLGLWAPQGVDLLVAPHHGSRGSSSMAFLRRLEPRIAVFSAGRWNRYAHPHPEVLSRYQKYGAQSLITGEVGAVTWRGGSPEGADTAR